MNHNVDTVYQQKAATLARMMAQENLVVRFANTATASFHPDTRVLTLPNFVKEAPECVRFGFNAHEIGHAIYTPAGTKPTSILNILEDVRIEKLVKRKYKGSALYMIEMCEHLFNDNFFGVDKISINNRPFLDRLNVYAKCRDAVPGLDVKFSDEEQKLVDKAFLTSSFEDVLTLGKEVKAFLKAQKKAQEEIVLPPMPEDEDSVIRPVPMADEDDEEDATPPADEETSKITTESDEGDAEESEDTATDKSEKTEEEKDEDESETEEETTVQTDETPDTDEEEQDEDDEEFESETYDHFEKMAESLVDGENMAEDAVCGHLDDANIITYKEWAAYLDENLSWVMSGGAKAQNFIASLRPQVMTMVKQFEAKRRASEWVGTSSHKTGELDVSRLSEYKFNDDIFIREDRAPQGKNHGLVLTIDLSGSMHKQISNVMKQAILLSMFAKQAGIPLKVYGFTSSYRFNKIIEDKRGERFVDSSVKSVVAESGTIILELVDTKSNKDFHRALETMYDVDRWFRYISGTTPLTSTAIVLSSVVAKWRVQNGIEILNSVFLTDGASSDINTIGGASSRSPTPRLLDTVTRKAYKFGYSNHTQTAYDIYKSRTGSRMTVLFMGSPKEIRHAHWSKDGLDDAIAASSKNTVAPLRGMFEGVVDLYMVMANRDKLSVADGLEVKEGKDAAASFRRLARARAGSKVFISLFMETMA